MSQNRKRRVTYGKSPLNRLEPHTQGLGDSARASTSHISPINESATSATSSIRTSRSSRLPKSSSNSPVTRGGNEDENKGDEHTVMPRKRRRSLHEEPYIDPTLRGMSSHAAASVGVNLGNAGLQNNINSRPKHPHRNNASRGGDTSRSASPNTTLEAKPINRPAYSYWRSTRRQKPASQLQDDRKGSSSSLGTSQRLDSASPRKRLVDSLGTADNGGSGAFAPMSHYVPKPLYSSDEVDFTSAGRRLDREAPDSRTCDPEHLRRSPPAPVPSSMLRSSGVTYSRQRSFLNDSLTLTDLEHHDMKNSHEFETEAEYLNVRSSRISPEEDDAQDSKPVRSIHELRRAGDNARFREVIDSIFEDIEDRYNSKSGTCCALAELCGKLLDSQFVHRFSEQGFDERLVNCTLNDLDLISASLALSAHRLIIVGGHTSRVFSDSLWARILELPPAVLDTEDDILILARKPSIGLSKTAQAAIRDVRSHLLPAMRSPSPCLSPQLLALECIRSSLVVLRESGHTIHPFSTLFLGKLIDLIAENAIKDLNSSAPKGQLEFLDRIFLILEDYSVISGPFDYNHCQCFHRLVRFHTVLSLDHRDRRHVSMSYIRVILNLTNKEPKLCDCFATPDIVCGLAGIVTTEFRDISRELCHQDDGTLNEVILALGTLINLAEKTKQSRAILISSDSRAVPFFRQLLEQFSDSVGTMDQAHSVADVHVNVVAGYLSILLLTICIDKEARHLVNEFRTGGGLALILSTAEKFLQYHREVEKDTGPTETWEQGESRLTTRLGHIIDQICRLEGLAHTVNRG